VGARRAQLRPVVEQRLQAETRVGPVRAGPAARVPGHLALQVHLLAGHERVAALGAARAARMEVVRLAGLQHLAGDVTFAVDASDAEQLLVVAFAVGAVVFGHVLAVQRRLALGALEAPHVPVEVERDQRLALVDALAAAGTDGAGLAPRLLLFVLEAVRRRRDRVRQGGRAPVGRLGLGRARTARVHRPALAAARATTLGARRRHGRLTVALGGAGRELVRGHRRGHALSAVWRAGLELVLLALVLLLVGLVRLGFVQARLAVCCKCSRSRLAAAVQQPLSERLLGAAAGSRVCRRRRRRAAAVAVVVAAATRLAGRRLSIGRAVLAVCGGGRRHRVALLQLEALLVVVLILIPEHVAGALLLAVGAVDFLARHHDRRRGVVALTERSLALRLSPRCLAGWSRQRGFKITLCDDGPRFLIVIILYLTYCAGRCRGPRPASGADSVARLPMAAPQANTTPLKLTTLGAS
jgi:hypothetical protein